MLALSYNLKLKWQECYKCGAPIALTESHYARLKQDNEDGAGFWCPRGHNQIFTTTETQRLQRELEAERKRRAWAEDNRNHWRGEAESLERSRNAIKGHLTRTKKRVGAGVCPCCKRTFKQLARHMQSQHPEYAEGNSG